MPRQDTGGRIFVPMPEATPMVIVEFGEPEHGWLPVTFRADEFRLELDASNVPVNPLATLCEALTVVLAGSSAQVLWYLEPAECWFIFENYSGSITLKITEKKGRTHVSTLLFQLTGTVKELLVPFYRALDKFFVHSHSEAHWPNLNKRNMAQLGQLLQNQL